MLPKHDVLGEVGREFHGSMDFVMHAFASPALWLAGAGVLSAWVFFLKKPELADRFEKSLSWIHTVLVRKYGFDWFNENVVSVFARILGGALWKAGDQALIDGALVNGSANSVGWVASVMRYAQSGYLYHYAFAMILGLASLLLWLLWRGAGL